MAELVSVKNWESMDYGNTDTIEWGDFKIDVKKTISYDEAAYIVKFVSNVVFSYDDGEYRPEAKEALIRSKILETYAGFRMPKSFEKVYYLAFQTDAYDVVSQCVNIDQINNIRKAIDDDIMYRLRIEAEGVKREIDVLANAINSLNDKYSEIFDGMSTDDMNNLVKSVSAMSEDKDDNADEEQEDSIDKDE